MKELKSISIKGFIALFALFLSCNNTVNELTDQQKKDITDEIEQILAGIYSLEGGGDAEQLISLKANTGDYVFASNGKIRYTDYDKYKESIRKNFKRVDRFIEFERTRTIIYPLAIDAATCTMELKGKYISTSSDTINLGGCWTSVYKKFDNEWKVIQENGAHTSE